jgi:hypothetical protein
MDTLWQKTKMGELRKRKGWEYRMHSEQNIVRLYSGQNTGCPVTEQNMHSGRIPEAHGETKCIVGRIQDTLWQNTGAADGMQVVN